MKVTVENKKGLNKYIKVFIDKKTMNSYMDEKYEEIKSKAVQPRPTSPLIILVSALHKSRKRAPKIRPKIYTIITIVVLLI